jgi:hypothetical protein
VARAGAGASRVQLRLRPVRSGSPPRDRHRCAVGDDGRRAGGRRRLVRGHRADRRPDACDPDARRLLRDTPAPGLARCCARRGGRRRGRGGLRRLERSAGARGPVRPPRCAPVGRPAGLRRPAPPAATARPAVSTRRAALARPSAKDGARAFAVPDPGGRRPAGRSASRSAAATHASAAKESDGAAAAGSAERRAAGADDAGRRYRACGHIRSATPRPAAPGPGAGHAARSEDTGAGPAGAAANGARHASRGSCAARPCAAARQDRARHRRPATIPPLPVPAGGRDRRRAGRGGCRCGGPATVAEAAQARSYH